MPAFRAGCYRFESGRPLQLAFFETREVRSDSRRTHFLEFLQFTFFHSVEGLPVAPFRYGRESLTLS
jgi:hypothetical protein